MSEQDLRTEFFAVVPTKLDDSLASRLARGGTCCLLGTPVLQAISSRSLDCEDRPRCGRSSSLGMTLICEKNNIAPVCNGLWECTVNALVARSSPLTAEAQRTDGNSALSVPRFPRLKVRAARQCGGPFP